MLTTSILEAGERNARGEVCRHSWRITLDYRGYEVERSQEGWGIWECTDLGPFATTEQAREALKEAAC